MKFTIAVTQVVGTIVYILTLIGGVLTAIGFVVHDHLSAIKIIILVPLTLIFAHLDALLWQMLSAFATMAVVGPVEWVVRMTIKGAQAERASAAATDPSVAAL